VGSTKGVEEIPTKGMDSLVGVPRALVANGGKFVDTWPRNADNDAAFGRVISRREFRDKLFVTTMWAAEFECSTRAQFSLKHILANPLLTSVSTETSHPQPMVDNLVTALGPLPDAGTRRRMRELIDRV
jgi:hypothetical protein